MDKLMKEPMTWYVVAVLPGLLAIGAWIDVFDGRFRVVDEDTAIALAFTAVAGAAFLRGYFLGKQKSQAAS